jgi:cell division FtsZ-interacting protein ZapD
VAQQRVHILAEVAQDLVAQDLAPKAAKVSFHRSQAHLLNSEQEVVDVMEQMELLVYLALELAREQRHRKTRVKVARIGHVGLQE